MRNLMRNQQPVFYRRYEGREEITDAEGRPTGSFRPKYGELKRAMLCVSPNKGAVAMEPFGAVEAYDRTMTTADTGLDIDENTVLWIDGADVAGPWNYIVKFASRWKNSAQYAIARVNVTEAERFAEDSHRCI